MFDNNISLELGWLDMGDTLIRYSSSAPGKAVIIEQTKSIYPATGRGFYIAPAYHYQISDKYQWKNSLGLSFWPQQRNIYVGEQF